MDERFLYFQLEPVDDSLFIVIQNEVFIEPPDPKAEIIIDLRDAANRTVQIRSILYPFEAFSKSVQSRILTFPFILNLDEKLNYGSVFTRVISNINLKKLISPPSASQISSVLYYINAYAQLMGGERLGFPIKDDIGVSIGIGTPYSGVLETNFVEFNFHILGLKAGIINSIDTMVEFKEDNNHNNLYTTLGLQASYVIPLGNFFEVSYQQIIQKASAGEMKRFKRYDTEKYQAKVLDGGYLSYELRYPFKMLGSTRSKLYFAKFLDEFHIGFNSRELTVAGSTFDLRFDYLLKSDVRQPQLVLEFLVQRIFDYWAYSPFAVGPGIVFSKTETGSFGMISAFINFRVKVGTSF
ncbi:MAG: hypothetical protein V1720_12680 [bacterium]